jgi:hypothetical protein
MDFNYSLGRKYFTCSVHMIKINYSQRYHIACPDFNRDARFIYILENYKILDS